MASRDLWFTEKAPTIKCIHCGQPKMSHLAVTHHCPLGAKNRTLGYTQYSNTKRFAPKPLTLRKVWLDNRAALEVYLQSHGFVGVYPKSLRLLQALVQDTNDTYLSRPKSCKP